MGQYKQKDHPSAALDIGIWLDLLEFSSGAGIGLSAYIIIFTSTQLTEIDPEQPESHAVLAAFIFQHLLFGLKMLLAEFIDDSPEWVTKDAG